MVLVALETSIICCLRHPTNQGLMQAGGVCPSQASPHLTFNPKLGCQPLVGNEERAWPGPVEGRPFQAESFVEHSFQGNVKKCQRQLNPAHLPALLSSGILGDRVTVPTAWNTPHPPQVPRPTATKFKRTD